jgi:hypothetical protein
MRIELVALGNGTDWAGGSMRPFFKDEDFNYLTEVALGATYHQAADVGEVLSTVERVRNGDAQSWVDEWSATADRLETEAAGNADHGHTRSAARQFLRASMYYSLASSSADGTNDPGLFETLWQRHRAAWDRFADLTEPCAEHIEIPYEGTTLPGYFFRAPGAGRGLRRTLVFNNGSDGPVTVAWVQGLADAIDRGWNAMTFDGPGQNAALVRQRLPFRPDWEEVITPVVDYLEARPDVDAGKIALLGTSQAGYWVPRAMAFEHRVAAAVADPGVLDVSTVMLGQVPHFMVKQLEAGEREKFDRDMDLALRFSRSTRALMTFRMRPYGTSSPYEFFTAARGYSLTDDLIGQITCPMLLTDPDHEQFWPGQSPHLYDKLPAAQAELIRFTEPEGADSHCEPAANGIRGERIFDWLDQHVPA